VFDWCNPCILSLNTSEWIPLRLRTAFCQDNCSIYNTLHTKINFLGAISSHIDRNRTYFEQKLNLCEVPVVFHVIINFYVAFIDWVVLYVCLLYFYVYLLYFYVYLLYFCVYLLYFYVYLLYFYVYLLFFYVYLMYFYVYLLNYVCIVVLTLDAGLLARSQYPEGPATGHLDTGFSWFPCVYKWMLRWFPNFQISTTCFSCSPPDLNFLVTFFFHICVHVK